MANPTLDVLLHPTRWRIVQSLTAGPKTVRALRADLGDVPQASLYRHLQPLLEAGLVDVTEENPARGAVERTYGLANSGVDAHHFETEDHRRAFAFLQATQLAEMDRYLARPEVDPAAEGLTYTLTRLHLDDEQRAALAAELQSLLSRYVARSSDAQRPVTVGLTMIPAAGAP